MSENRIGISFEEGKLPFPENELEELSSLILAAAGEEGRELSLFFCGLEKMAELNEGYRGKEGPTDVLSFAQLDSNAASGDRDLLGDVVICRERMDSQAEEFGTGQRGECARLILHGILHLLGYDHETGGEDAEKMRAEEERIMSNLEDWVAG